MEMLARETRDDPISVNHAHTNMTTTTTPTSFNSSTPSLSSTTTERKSSATWSSSSQSRNPVAMRLYKVLSTNFEDEDTRQALHTLSDLYAAPLAKGKEPASANGVEEDIDDADGSDGLSTNAIHVKSAYDLVLAEAYPGEFAAKARKNLRKDMEKKLADTSRRFLEALGEVDAVGDCIMAVIQTVHPCHHRNCRIYRGMSLRCGKAVRRRKPNFL